MEILFKLRSKSQASNFLSFSSYHMRVTLPENTIFYNEVKQSVKSIWIFYSLKRCSISCHLKKKKEILICFHSFTTI